jgi:hypothetical protein
VTRATPDMRDWDAERELAYRLGSTLTEAALAGVTFDKRNRTDLAHLLPDATKPLEVPRLLSALIHVWPRTFGNRLSWAQPSVEMAVAIAREYERLAP